MAPEFHGESDGIEEALESSVRMAVMVGARVGAEIARAREERLREQRRLDEREAGRLAERFEAEKRTALAELSHVHRPDWWERADPARIGQTYATARAWASEGNEAAGAEQKMRQELRSRYGIDVDRIDRGSMGAEVEAWRQRLEQQRGQDTDRQRAVEIGERTEAARLLDQAARDDRAAEVAREDERSSVSQAERMAGLTAENPWRDVLPQTNGGAEARLEAALADDQQRARDHEARNRGSAREAGRLYDSAERRAADARNLEARGIESQVAESRMRADIGRAKPATLATADTDRTGRAPKARRSRGKQAQLPGIAR